ncbi:MAG: 50S ribosomal protein L18e [Acidilobus sp.]
MRRTGPTNQLLRETIEVLEKASKERPVWGRVAELLLRPTRTRPEVNLSKINRYASDGDVVLVPGKVLGAGSINKKVTVAAFTFSKKAAEKITAAGGRILTLREAVAQVQDYSKVKILA